MHDTARIADFKPGRAMHSIATASVSRAVGFFKGCWSAYQDRRERARVRAILYGMPNRELKDIGICRSEIEYLVSMQSREW
jgi:uncharacterized protein YjiS (DUF1127 family)